MRDVTASAEESGKLEEILDQPAEEPERLLTV